MPAAVEDALWELVARGLVTGDGMAGLRVLLQPEAKRRQPRHHLRSIRGGQSPQRTMPVGRWALWGLSGEEAPSDQERIERFARQLLKRYGVVFRELVARESFTVSWREVLRALRRREARGGVRGGRFVAGFIGEQYALPEAVEGLRRVRREERTGETVRLRPCDPLNLVGVLLPGPRVPAQHGVWIELRDGAVVSADAPAPRGSNATASARS